MEYNKLFENESFCRIAEIIRFSTANSWRNKFKMDTISLQNEITSQMRDAEFEIESVLRGFTDFLTEVTLADNRLWYMEKDLVWLVKTLDLPQSERKAALWILMAYASAPDERITPVDAHEITGDAASTWRNRCAQGEVLGAEKLGKQWTLPRSIVKSWNNNEKPKEI